MRVVVYLLAILSVLGPIAPIITSGASEVSVAAVSVSHTGNVEALGNSPYLLTYQVPGLLSMPELYPHELGNRVSNLSYAVLQSQEAGADEASPTFIELSDELAAAEHELRQAVDRMEDLVRTNNRQRIAERAPALITRLAQEGVVPKVVHTMAPSMQVDLTETQAKSIEAWTDIVLLPNDAVWKPMLNVARQVVRANHMENLGYNGDGTVVTVIDSGVNLFHPDISVFEFNHDTCWDGFASGSPHGTIVAGVIASRDTQALGIATGTEIGSVLVEEYNPVTGKNEVPGENVLCALDLMATADRHYAQMSFGAIGEPISEPSVGSAATDYFAYHYDIFEVIAAGNARKRVSSPCDNYNGLCVGGMEDKNTVTKSDDEIWINEGQTCDGYTCGSSFGPTANGRYKPELVAPAQNIKTPNFVGDGYEDADNDGTSLAAPAVMGIVAGMAQRSPALNLDVRKAILVSGAIRATPFNSGWDGDYGWGYPFGERAINNIGNGWYMSGTISEGEIDTLSRTFFEGDGVHVVLNWRRSVSSTYDYGAKNDLEICYVRPNNSRTCEILDAPNHTEYTSFCATTSGTYKIEVHGVDVSGSQSYGLAFDKRSGCGV